MTKRFYEEARKLPEKHELIEALLRYEFYGEEPTNLTGTARALFEIEIEDKRRLTSRINGAKGGRPKGSKTTRHEAEKPEINEIEEYITENGLHVNAREFFEYYAKRNWKTGGDPIGSWRGLLRKWNEQASEKESLLKALKA